MLHFLRMDLSHPADYKPSLAAMLQQGQAPSTVVMYLATAPDLFTTVCEQIAAVHLNTAPYAHRAGETRWGTTWLPTAPSTRRCAEYSTRSRCSGSTTYLGKPAVQNLFAMRFGNALFEPLWRREHIANIQITIAEQLGVEKRGAFYDTTGALRDMVQNHALQLLCAIGMGAADQCACRCDPGRKTEGAAVAQALDRGQPG